MAEQAAPASSAAAGESAQLHNDAALVDFLSSLNDYTPTVLLYSPRSLGLTLLCMLSRC
jgi:hypothetical protein